MIKRSSDTLLLAHSAADSNLLVFTRVTWGRALDPVQALISLNVQAGLQSLEMA